MSANATTAAPTGRKKLAQGKECSDAALGHDSPSTSSPEGAKENGELPDGWRHTTVDESVRIIDYRGRTPPFDGTVIPHLRSQNVKSGRIVWEDLAYVSEGTYSAFMTRGIPQTGDILFTTEAPLGEVAPVPEQRFSVAQRIMVLRPAPEFWSPLFLMYQLMSPEVQARIRRKGTGSTVTGVASRNFKPLALRVAPLPEQRRIVAEIEKQFTRLEAGVTALRRVQANLKRYRAAVLKAACEGKLVLTEAELQKSERRGQKSKAKFETGAELLARILTERRQNWQGRGQYKEPSAPVTAHLPPFPAGWAVASLEQLTSAARPICYGILMPKENVATGVLFVKVKDMKGDTIDLDGLHRTTPEIAAKYARASLRTGDLLLSIRGTYGRVAEVPKELDGGNITQDTARLDVTGLINHRYVATCLRNPDCQNHFKRVARGVAVKGVNIGDVRPTPVPLPPLAEQTRIVAEVERRLSVVEELESVVSANLQRATRLRQSILQKAFTGELA